MEHKGKQANIKQCGKERGVTAGMRVGSRGNRVSFQKIRDLTTTTKKPVVQKRRFKRK